MSICGGIVSTHFTGSGTGTSLSIAYEVAETHDPHDKFCKFGIAERGQPTHDVTITAPELSVASPLAKQVYDPHNWFRFPIHTWVSFWNQFKQNILQRSLLWMEWTGGIPLGVLLALLSKPRSHSFTQKAWLFTAPALILLVGYFFFPGSGTLQYGPRYLYESFGLLLIPAAQQLLRWKRWTPRILTFVLCFNLGWFLKETLHVQALVQKNIQFFQRIHQLSYAIVFVRGPNPLADLYSIRNGTHFHRSVVLVLDGGRKLDQKIIRHYPTRSFYLCQLYSNHSYSIQFLEKRR